MLVAWIVQKFDDVILLGDAKPEDRFWMLLARGTILAVILGIALLTAMSRPLRKASERT
jgi:hypothetical protein